MSEAERAELSKGLFSYSVAGLTALLAVNGGASASLLSLLGNIWQKDPIKGALLGNALAWPLFILITGTSLVPAIAIMAYLSQSSINQNGGIINRSGANWRYTAIGAAVASNAAFLIGSVWAGIAIKLIAGA